MSGMKEMSKQVKIRTYLAQQSNREIWSIGSTPKNLLTQNWAGIVEDSHTGSTNKCDCIHFNCSLGMEIQRVQRYERQ